MTWRWPIASSSASASRVRSATPARAFPAPTPSCCRRGAAPASPTGAASPSPTGPIVQVFFGSADLDPCEGIVGVPRTVETADPESALRALLAGPTTAETAAGYQSWFSAATADALSAFELRDGVARVSFRDLRMIIPNASSSCGSGMLLSALDRTLLQFPQVTRTRYSIEGDEAAFYEWLQRGVPEE